MGETADQSANVLYNPFAAVPSMHVAFALMIAVPAIILVKHRVLKVLWAFYSLVVTFVVMVTANHFWLDAALGALVAAASAYAASAAFARARPRHGPGAPPGPRHTRERRGPRAAAGCEPGTAARSALAGDAQALARDRLIESRLTPNAISVTG